MRSVIKSLKTLSIMLLLLTVIDAGTILGQEKKCACCTEPYKQFDFWIGDWNVYDTLGNKIGENLIVSMQDNCLLQENWKSKRSTGTSYNYYNAADNSWNQVWVDNSGNPLVLKGDFIDGKMVMRSELKKSKKGTEYYDQISWQLMPDKSVVQIWKQFDKQGDELTLLFKGVYRLKNQ